MNISTNCMQNKIFQETETA